MNPAIEAACAVLDRWGHFLHAEEAISQWGFSPEELQGVHLAAILAPTPIGLGAGLLLAQAMETGSVKRRVRLRCGALEEAELVLVRFEESGELGGFGLALECPHRDSL